MYAYTRFADPPFIVPNERRAKEWRDSKPLPLPIEPQQYHRPASIPSSPSPIACLTSIRTRCQFSAMASGNDFRQRELFAMWQDNKTRSKWVFVNRCYFANDLLEADGCPCSPESYEVYESNHSNTIVAGLIRGPCVVLPPSKFNEESGRRTRFGARGK